MQKLAIVTDIERVREVLRSDRARVLVEAPAGCGKTYEAVGLACAIGAELPQEASVLLLTHTHAAKNEFSRRAATTTGATRVRVSTIDSFLVDMCMPHAAALGLPYPLRTALAEKAVKLPEIAQKALELVRRCPLIAEVIATRHPVIILDEHQDASVTQHDVVDTIAATADMRLRIFGDPMQAIYDFGETETLSWSALVGSADAHCMLSQPWRWSKNVALGTWINDARQRLAALQSLPPIPRDIGVSMVTVPGLSDPGFATHFDVRLVSPLRSLSSNSSSAVLTYMNHRADALVIQTGGSFTLNEGAEFSLARDTVKALCDAAQDARKLAAIVVEMLSASTVGFDASRKTQCLSALKASGIDAGRKKNVSTILDALNEIYSKPSVATACRAFGRIMRSPPDWLKRTKFPRNLDAIAAIGDSSEEPREALESIVAHDRQLARTVPRSISTIHKAKGLEYEAVLLWNFSSTDFPMDRKSAKLLYVAISRPTNQLMLVAPGQSLSPFAPPDAVG